MFRFRFNLPNKLTKLQYGVPQANALTTGYLPRSVYFVSENNILYSTLPEFDETSLSLVEHESPIVSVDATQVVSISNPIQAICSTRREDRQSCLICIIDNRGAIYIYEDKGDQNLTLYKTFQHQSSSSFGLEESWTSVSFSPSGKRLFSLHGLSSSVMIFDLEQSSQCSVIYTSGHPFSACWRDEETVVVAENKQLSQYYTMAGRECTSFNRISVGSNPIRVVCCFREVDNVVACTEDDRGVFGLNSRALKIVSRWKAPIRSMVVGAVTETTECKEMGGTVNVAYFCGDDNEVLMYNSSGREEKDSALKERHTINIRSRSRIIGMQLENHCLYVLGQNGDLDVISNPCSFMLERRKRKHCEDSKDEMSKMLNDD